MFEALSALTAAPSSPSLPPAIWLGIDNSVFVCPVAKRANSSAEHGITTYRYRYFGVFPKTAISYTSGAWHSSELLALFGVVPSDPVNIPAELAIRTYMREAWAAFANDLLNGLSNYGWPEYVPSGKTLVQLAANNMTGTNLAYASIYDVICDTLTLANGSILGSNGNTTNTPVQSVGKGLGTSAWPTLGLVILLTSLTLL